MNYAELNKTQKRVIDAFISLNPELSTASSISRTEIESLFAKLAAARETGGPKLGYPMWLVKGPKVGRGNYVFPAPNVKNETLAVIGNKSIQAAAEDLEFLADLKEMGIELN